MANAERDLPSMAQFSFADRLVAVLKKIFKKKSKFEELEAIAWEAEQQRRHEERRSEQEKEADRRRRELEEAQKAYHQRESVQTRVESEAAYRNLEAEEVRQAIDNFR